MREILEKRKKKHKKTKIILITILILILSLVGFIAYRTYKNGGGMRGFLATMLGHDEHTVETLDELFVLLVGESGGMTDTIMLCSYDPKTQEASMLSIPRDTFIGTNKGYATSFDKINSVYNNQGIEGLVSEVEELTNIEIPFYIKVDTESLKALVDTIGGVYFDVPIDMNYDDNKQNLHIHLKAGYQHLDGDKAEQVVRFRHNNDGTSYSMEYGDNDYGRMKTQREFLKAVLKQTIKLGNVTKINKFIDIGSKYVKTNINVKDIKDYVPYILDFKLNDLKTATLPGVSEKCNGVWVFIHNQEETKLLIDNMFLTLDTEKIKEQKNNETIDNNTIENATIDDNNKKEEIDDNEIVDTDITANDIKDEEIAELNGIKIELINGASTKNQLAIVENLLTKSGYTVERTGTTNITERTIIINKSNKSEKTEEKLKELIGVGYISNLPEKESDIDFTIIIGNDF